VCLHHYTSVVQDKVEVEFEAFILDKRAFARV
jgi:hypothetical protein